MHHVHTDHINVTELYNLRAHILLDSLSPPSRKNRANHKPRSPSTLERVHFRSVNIKANHNNNNNNNNNKEKRKKERKKRRERERSKLKIIMIYPTIEPPTIEGGKRSPIPLPRDNEIVF